MDNVVLCFQGTSSCSGILFRLAAFRRLSGRVPGWPRRAEAPSRASRLGPKEAPRRLGPDTDLVPHGIAAPAKRRLGRCGVVTCGFKGAHCVTPLRSCKGAGASESAAPGHRSAGADGSAALSASKLCCSAGPNVNLALGVQRGTSGAAMAGKR